MNNHCFNVKIMASITLFIRSGVIFPIFRKTICLSAVKTRNGRINESTGNEPDIKSSDFSACANISSFVDLDVIWQIIISSPRRSVKTKAGRLLLPDKLEKGKGTTTTSPFTNLSMPHLPQELTNLLPKRFQSQDSFVLCLPFSEESLQPDLPVCEQALITTVRCFSTYFLSLRFP